MRSPSARTALVFFSLLMWLLNSRCNKSTLLGQNLIPGVDNIHTFQTDTITLTANNILLPNDTILTSGPYYESTLGAVSNDPVFGSTQSVVYTQVGLSNNAFSFVGTEVAIDSVVLSAAYDGYYGDTLSAQKINVYPIIDPGFNIDSNYFFFDQIPYDANQLLGSATVTAKSLHDSVSIMGVTSAPQLRIRLSQAFGNNLLQQTPDGAFQNDSTFHAFLNGLAIVADTNNNGQSLLFLNINSPDTKITVYYHNSTTDSLNANFAFDAYSCAHTNYISHNYTGSIAANYINTNNTSGDSLLFLQGSPGLSVKLKLPYLQNFPPSIINRAEIIVTQIKNNITNNNFAEPPALNLQLYNADSTLQPLPASGFEIPEINYFASYPVTYITDTQGQRLAQYHINITRFMQQVITKTLTNNGFRLYIPFYNLAAYRLFANGNAQNNFAIKLSVVYTKL